MTQPPARSALLAPPRAWPRWAAALAGLLLLGGGAWLWRLQAVQHSCEDMEHELEGVWDAPRREAIRQSFLATRKVYAEAHWRWVDTGLERYTRAWVRLRRDACEAARGGEQPEPQAALRLQCLNQRRQELMALGEALAQMDGQTLPQIDQSMEQLVPPESCADPSYLTLWQLLPEDPTLRGRLESLLGRLAQTQALSIAGNTQRGLAQAVSLTEAAEATGFRPLIAEAWLVRARLEYSASDAAAAVESAHRSARAFLASGQMKGLALAWLELVSSLQQLGQEAAPQQEQWLQYLEESLIAAGNPAGLRAQALVKLAYIRSVQGRYQEGLEHARKAASIEEQLHGAESATLANALVEQLRAGMLLGRYEEALAAGQRALALRKARDGLEHPVTLRVLGLMGVLQTMTWHLADSSATYEQLLAIMQRLPDVDYEQQASVLNNLAVSYLYQGRYSESEPLLEQALALLDKNHARESLHGAICLQSLAESRLLSGQSTDALRLAQEALSIAEKKLPPKHTILANVLLTLGEAHLAAGHASQASASLERALQQLDSDPSQLKERGRARFALAKALHALGREEARVQLLLMQARKDFAEAGAPASQWLQDWERWTRAQRLHPAPTPLSPR